MRQCRKNAEMHKAYVLAAALQADKTKKSFWQKVNNKNRSPSLPTLLGGANGGSEIVKMWKDYFKGILNSENSGNGSAEFVEHSIDCKENYLGPEMVMPLLFRWHYFFNSCPWTRHQGLILFLQSTCSMQVNLYAFLCYCFLYVTV